MGEYETFRRVQQVYESGRPLAYGATRRNAKTRSGVPKTSRREPTQARPETWVKEKAESNYAAFRFRPLGNLLEYGFRFFIFLRRQFCVSQSLAHDLSTEQPESVRIVHILPIVETEHLFVQIPEHVERLNAHIRSMQSALEQAPEVLQGVCVYATMHVLDSVIYDLMSVVGVESDVSLERIGIECRTSLHLFPNDRLQVLFLALCDDLCTNLPATLQESDYDRLVIVNAACEAGLAILVHVARLAADESLIDFDFSIRAAAKLATVETVLHPEADAVKHEPRGLLCDAQRAVNFPRANSVLAIGNHPHHRQPLIQTKRGILKDGPGLNAELRLRVPRLALPQTARRDVSNVSASTRGADRSLWPAPICKVVDAIVEVREVLNRLYESLGCGLHESIMAQSL